MGSCVSVDVKYSDVQLKDNIMYKSPSYTEVCDEKTRLEQKCDDLGTEMLGMMPRAPIIRI